MDEILINSTTRGIQQDPAIDVVRGSSDMHFIVVWRDGSDFKIKGQAFFMNGNRSGGEFVIGGGADNADVRLPVIAATASGFVVAWIQRGFPPLGPRPHVMLRRFNRDGGAISGEIQISTNDVDDRQRPALAALGDGGYLVVWADSRADERIRAQRFQIDGTKNGAEFRVNGPEGFHRSPLASQMEDGQRFIIGWTHVAPGGRQEFHSRAFLLDGTPRTEHANNLSGFIGSAALTGLNRVGEVQVNTGFALAHVRAGRDDTGFFDQNMVELNEFTRQGSFLREHGMNTIDTNALPAINASSPAVAALPGGRVVAVWAQKRADTTNPAKTIMAKVFKFEQGPVGNAIQVNTTAAGDKTGLCAAAFADGQGEHVFIAWLDDSKTGADTSDFAVRGRAFTVLASGGLA